MTTIITTHILCTKKIKSVRRNLQDLLYFDPQFSDNDEKYDLISDAEDMGYTCNLDFLQDRLMYYYYKRDRELEMGAIHAYDYEDDESECIQFALESLIEYLQRNTEDRLDYSVKILGDTVSAVVTAHIFD
jgi:hypothetical protein